MGVTVKFTETSQDNFAYTYGGQNYIQDGNFSRGKLLIPFLGAVRGTLSIQTSGGYYGANCLKFTATSDDAFTIPYDGRTAVLAAAAPNEKWTFSVFAKGASGGENIDLFIFPLSNVWSYLTPVWVNKTVTTTWTRYSVTATMPAGTTGIGVRLGVNTSGNTVYFDGVMLEKSDTAGAVYDQSSVVDLDLAFSPGDLILGCDLIDGFEGDSHTGLYDYTGGTWEIMSTVYKSGNKSIRGKSSSFSGGLNTWDTRYYKKNFSPPVYAEVWMYYPVATGYFNQGISFGVQGTQSFYFARYDTANKIFVLEKLVNGTETVLASTTTSTSLTGWIKMAVWWGTSGSIIARLYNSSGVLQATLTKTDTTFTTGKVGLVVAQGFANHADARFDDFIIRSISSGTRESRLMVLNSVGTVKSSKIEWSATTNGQTVKIETCISTDAGSTWSSWSQCTNGGSIPGLTDGLDVSNGRVRCRQTLSTADMSVTPVLHSIDLSVSPSPHAKSVSVDISASRSISGSAYSAKTLNLDTARLVSLSGLARSEKTLALESVRSGLLFNVKKVRSVSMESVFTRGLTAHFLRYAQAYIASSTSDPRVQIAKAVQAYIESLCTYWEAFPAEYFYRYLPLQLRCDISKIISGLWSREEHEPSGWSKKQVGASVWTKRPAPVPGQWTRVGTSSGS